MYCTLLHCTFSRLTDKIMININCCLSMMQVIWLSRILYLNIIYFQSALLSTKVKFPCCGSVHSCSSDLQRPQTNPIVVDMWSILRRIFHLFSRIGLHSSHIPLLNGR